jgi:phosphate-selective porin OprO/OprP
MWDTVRRGTILLGLIVLLATQTSADEASTGGGLKIESDDGQFSAQFGGRIQIDAAAYDQDITPLNNGAELRRARFFIKGVLYKNWQYKLETDFAEDQLDVTDAYVKHKPTGIILGQYKVPFTLEQLTSSRFISFMERAADGVREGRRLSVGWQGHGHVWTVGASLFGQAIGDETQGDEGVGFAVRGVFRPWQTEDGNLIHLGLSTFSQQPADETEMTRVRQRPWSHVTDVRFVDTGDIDNVDGERGINAEFSSVFGSFSVQAEYTDFEIERHAGFTDENFDVWYVYGTWMSRGSKRGYDSKIGAYTRSKVKNGTWELGLRYSVFDLQSTTIPGGRQEGWTVGLNYYVNPKLRFMGNFLLVDTEDSAVTLDGENEQINIVQFRLSVDF